MPADYSQSLGVARQNFDKLVGPLRPKLHRYCAGMTGSIVDGEDVVQDTLAKAFYALPNTTVGNLEGWLFRIAHNTALDHLRAKQRHDAVMADDDVELLIDEIVVADDLDLASTALGTLMRLPPRQRSCVLLKDVLGHSIAEICDLIDASTASVKASLHRGRQHLRRLAETEANDQTPSLDEPEKSLLAAYVSHFNARNFDAIRAMLSEEVRLDIAGGHGGGHGKQEVGGYFNRYDAVEDWYFKPGTVEGLPAAMAYDPQRTDGRPIYFVLLSWDDGKLVEIRDFRYARYAIDWGWPA
jgi:RNA polymerase sigma-70 factor (ECF subfamily)